jgi:hypothetical protein
MNQINRKLKDKARERTKKYCRQAQLECAITFANKLSYDQDMIAYSLSFLKALVFSIII